MEVGKVKVKKIDLVKMKIKKMKLEEMKDPKVRLESMIKYRNENETRECGNRENKSS